MASNSSLHSTDSDVFYVEQSSNDQSVPRPNTPIVLNSTEISGEANNNNYSPQSPEPSEPSSISTPPMNISTFNSWETSYTTTDNDTFHSSDEPRKIYFLPPSPASPPSPPRMLKRRLSLGMSFPKEGGVSQHIC